MLWFIEVEFLDYSFNQRLTCVVKAVSFFLLMVRSSMVSGTDRLMSLLDHKRKIKPIEEF